MGGQLVSLTIVGRVDMRDKKELRTTQDCWPEHLEKWLSPEMRKTVGRQCHGGRDGWKVTLGPQTLDTSTRQLSGNIKQAVRNSGEQSRQTF